MMQPSLDLNDSAIHQDAGVYLQCTFVASLICILIWLFLLAGAPAVTQDNTPSAAAAEAQNLGQSSLMYSCSFFLGYSIELTIFVAFHL